MCGGRSTSESTTGSENVCCLVVAYWWGGNDGRVGLVLWLVEGGKSGREGVQYEAVVGMVDVMSVDLQPVATMQAERGVACSC